MIAGFLMSPNVLYARDACGRISPDSSLKSPRGNSSKSLLSAMSEDEVVCFLIANNESLTAWVGLDINANRHGGMGGQPGIHPWVL